MICRYFERKINYVHGEHNLLSIVNTTLSNEIYSISAEFFIGGLIVGKNSKICPDCGRKMKQQFIGLQHCKCGISFKKDIGFFERTNDMVFALQRQVVKKSKNSVKVLSFDFYIKNIKI